MRTEKEVAALLASHEKNMAAASKREEHYSHGRHEDREEALAAAHDYQASKDASEVLKWVLCLETDVNYKHLFPNS
jgi:hypothetical protein